MARPLRLEHEFALWHITSRGNERKSIFRDDRDRDRFLHLLGETVTRFRWRLFAWVLMSNHFHLVLQTPETNLSRGMQWLNGRYAQYFNRRHGRCGHLFQGRFHGALVEKEAYFLAVVRYVVLNPVRAGIVRNPSDWKWSSYRQTAGLEPVNRWLAVEDLLENFGGANDKGCSEYIHYVSTTDSASPWHHLTRQIYLGRATWLKQMAQRMAERTTHRSNSFDWSRPQRLALSQIVATVAKIFDVTGDQIVSHSRHAATARGVVAFLAFEDGLYTQQHVATSLGLNKGTIASMVRRCRALHAANPQFAEVVDLCRRLNPGNGTAPGLGPSPEWNLPPVAGSRHAPS